jgi:hypothetical protein
MSTRLLISTSFFLRSLSLNALPRKLIWLLLMATLVCWLYVGYELCNTQPDAVHPGLITTRDVPPNWRLRRYDLKNDPQASARVQATLPRPDDVAGQFVKNGINSGKGMPVANIAHRPALSAPQGKLIYFDSLKDQRDLATILNAGMTVGLCTQQQCFYDIPMLALSCADDTFDNCSAVIALDQIQLEAVVKSTSLRLVIERM